VETKQLNCIELTNYLDIYTVIEGKILFQNLRSDQPVGCRIPGAAARVPHHQQQKTKYPAPPRPWTMDITTDVQHAASLFFLLTPTSVHAVTPVTENAKGKRLVFGGCAL
jgi:hypothetical protein